MMPHLLTLAFGRPLMIEPCKLGVITAVLAARHGIELRGPEGWASPKPEMIIQTASGDQRTRAGLRVTLEGVAVLPIEGPLVHRRMPDAESGGPTTYKTLAWQLKDAAEDPGVRAILLEIDSPGGEVGGAFQLADHIYRARQIKPIWAIANEGAYSAAYAQASSASRVLLPPTAGVGSIGIFWQHMSQAGFDKGMGLEFTVIQAGARKNDFNPHFKVDPEAVAWAQAEVDRVYGIFAATVARNRGLDEKAVRATEAALIFGESAVEAGLADGIADLDQALAELTEYATSNRLGSATSAGLAAGPNKPKTEESEMTDKAKKPAAEASSSPAPETKANAQAENSQASEATKAGRDQATEATKAERARVAAILGCEEAQGRDGLAKELVAQGTDAEVAKKILAAAPKESAGSPLDRAMAGAPNPNVGAGVESEPGGSDLLAARMDAKVASRYGGMREV